MNKKKLLSSIGLVTLAISALFAGGTVSYFTDTEVSEGNVLAAGTLDLQIDNTSYYNGELWEGTTWNLANLDDGQGPAGGKYHAS